MSVSHILFILLIVDLVDYSINSNSISGLTLMRFDTFRDCNCTFDGHTIVQRSEPPIGASTSGSW